MRRPIFYSLRRTMMLFLIASMVAVVSFPTTAAALITDGRGNYGDCGAQMMRAYFANQCGDPYIDANGDSGFVMPKRNVGGIMRPALYGINDKTALYNYLVGATGLGSGIQQSRVGAAFIIHTMLGRDGNQANAAGGKTISAADRSALQEALQNPDIGFSIGSYSNRYNSGSRVVNGAIDESFFDNSLGGGTVSNVSSIILRKLSTNTVVYVLEIECANPIGVPRPGLDEPWNSLYQMEMREVNTGTPSTPIGPGVIGDQLITGQVNHRYGWFWSVRNIGPNPTNVSIVREREWTFPAPHASSPGWVSAGVNAGAGVASGQFIFGYNYTGSTPLIQPTDAGKTFCLRVRYDPSRLDGTMYTSPDYCVVIAYNYELDPNVTMSSQTADIGGTPPNLTYNITNNGPSISEPVTFTVKQFVGQPGETVSYATRNGVAGNCGIPSVSGCAVDIYTSGTAKPYNLGVTQIISSGSGGITNPATNTYPIPPLTPADMDRPAGSKICRVLVVSRGSEAGQNRWGEPVCVTIGKKPHMSIINGDGWAGGRFKALNASCTLPAQPNGGFRGSFSTFGSSSYGSFGEYQLFATGLVSSFASGGKVTTGVSPAPVTLSSSLTYKGPLTLGQFYTSTTGGVSSLTSHCLGDAMGYYGGITPSSTLGTNVAPSSLASGVHKRTGDLTIDAGGAIPAGRHVVIIATGKVTINGNITLAPGPYASLGDIPSFTLISGTNVAAPNKNIEVSSAVTQLDGIYQTYGQFITCYQSVSGGIGLDSPNCKEQLVVNGTVTADKFVLRRIKGADRNDRATSGEVFNYRSDIFLSAFGDAQTSTQLRTASEQELPPRY